DTKIVVEDRKDVQAVGMVAVGSSVEIKGLMQADGSINAAKIEVENDAEAEFKGKIESLPATNDLVGDWRVSGRTVRVTAMTEIERKYGMVAVGAFVEVEGTMQADGSVLAQEIEVKQGNATGAYMSYSQVATVSAASYQDDNAPGAIVSGFGVKMSLMTAVAGQLPLPISMAGASVFVDGKQARLFAVSQTQINYVVPLGTPTGTASVVVTNNRQVVSQGTVHIS